MTRFANRAQMLSMYALGIGGAAYDVRHNGERLPLGMLDGPVTVFDVGAHLGEYAELALGVLPDANLHCFEPAPDTFAALRERLGGRAALHHVALSDEPGEGALQTDSRRSGLASLHPLRRLDTTATTVTVETIERICSAHAIDRIDLLKLDVEGAELEALRGAGGVELGIVQFEFGQNSLEARTYLRDFYDLLGATHRICRVTPHALVPLGEYRQALEVFYSATNYAAVPM